MNPPWEMPIVCRICGARICWQRDEDGTCHMVTADPPDDPSDPTEPFSGPMGWVAYTPHGHVMERK